ncbi:hypothetical protein GGX14DRAFT_574980 [Mycena pura]|uniref:Uncharacterized protein n=1 Tax=Mycena pura TaxID=153505 RepID=A0AAD6UY61_9AGAR|nr:hypothetical protein GGX14DRAFT_574980 [Mycena pura]
MLASCNRRTRRRVGRVAVYMHVLLLPSPSLWDPGNGALSSPSTCRAYLRRLLPPTPRRANLAPAQRLHTVHPDLAHVAHALRSAFPSNAILRGATRKAWTHRGLFTRRRRNLRHCNLKMTAHRLFLFLPRLSTSGLVAACLPGECPVVVFCLSSIEVRVPCCTEQLLTDTTICGAAVHLRVASTLPHHIDWQDVTRTVPCAWKCVTLASNSIQLTSAHNIALEFVVDVSFSSCDPGHIAHRAACGAHCAPGPDG